ncbi:hypothetical protein SALBM217S_03906 [Streptomyces griseoloalbus]
MPWASTARAISAAGGRGGPDSVHQAPACSCSVGYAANATRPLAERCASTVQSWPSISQRTAATGPGPAAWSSGTGLPPGRQAHNSPPWSVKKSVVRSADVRSARRVPGRAATSAVSSRVGVLPGSSWRQWSMRSGVAA